MQIAGKNVINKPCRKDPYTQPFNPPSAFPKTPAVAPQKKCGITPGKIKATGIILELIAPRMNNPTIPPKKEIRNPIKTAFGAYGYTTGQSNAGFAFGTSFSAIPRNAGTISLIIRRTPDKMIYTPPAKLRPCVNA